MVMPLLTSFIDVLNEGKKYDLYQKVCIMIQLLKAKIELRKVLINHRDLKLDNILLESSEADVTQDFTVKLTDFDISN